jgi:hypothetical protein
MHFYLLITLLLLTACGEPSKKRLATSPQTIEPILRKQGEFAYRPLPLKLSPIPSYPWEKPLVGNHPPITKEFFRCKGSTLNPVHTFHDKNETVRYYDCGGASKHSLPLRDGKEFVYPILIDLLNYIQAETGRRVIITSGHRCPEHNSYCDPSISNQTSKHTVGAEVTFYVQGLESEPEKAINLIQKYYKTRSSNTPFERYTKKDTNVSTPPWYNKEIFIKLFQKSEGRDFDNRHPFPYISLQVRYDNVSKERVSYDWNAAHKNYLRK